MSWQFTDDVDTFADTVWPLLSARPVENTAALTVIDSLRAGRRWSTEPLTLGWYASSGPNVTGAVLRTPPYELLLASVPAHTVHELVTDLHLRGLAPPGINGEMSCAQAVAQAWAATTGGSITVRAHRRLYQLGTLKDPEPSPPGGARVANSADAILVADWFLAFHAETGSPAVDVRAAVLHRINAGLVWLWQDTTDHVVAMAARNVATARTARVGPVYTPAEHRRHGFGAAVTAACTRDALARDADTVVLFTDLANLTSNAIYQQIGYRPVSDHQIIRFG